MRFLKFGVVLLIVAGCKKETQIQLFSGSVFQENENFLYEIVDNQKNEKVAESKISVEHIPTGNIKISEDISGSEVIVHPENLTPKSSKLSIQTPQGDRIEITAEYKKDSIYLVAKTPQGEKNIKVSKESNTYDNYSLLMVLRGMDFQVGKRIELNNFVSPSGRGVKTAITVDKKETIEIPEGSFETYHVSMDFGTQIQYAWYEVNLPHRLIKYDNGNIHYRLTSKEPESTK